MKSRVRTIRIISSVNSEPVSLKKKQQNIYHFKNGQAIFLKVIEHLQKLHKTIIESEVSYIRKNLFPFNRREWLKVN